MKTTKQSLFAGVILASISAAVFADNVINDDNIVDDSECVGMDCVNGENFGFDTLRLKENNLRIHFDDTSSSASFSDNDWRIVINDTTNGGAEYFAVEDATAGKKIMQLNAGAPANSVFVSNKGHLGLGTATPALDIHVASGDTPAIRLEQDGSAGYSPRVWDIAGNETNFFVRDVNNGSALVFRVRAGAPGNSIYVANDGKLGFGTDKPKQRMHVVSNDRPKLYLQDSSDASRSWLLGVSEDENDALVISNLDNPDAGIALEKDGTVILKGDLAVEGTTYTLSSRSKKDVQGTANDDQVLGRLDKLPIYYWNYKKDTKDIRHLGPMAEDFHQVFDLGNDPSHITSTDTAGVAFAAIKALNEKVKAQDAQDCKARGLGKPVNR